MSTILKALRRLEEDRPSAAAPATPPDVDACDTALPSEGAAPAAPADPVARESVGLRDRLLAEDVASRAVAGEGGPDAPAPVESPAPRASSRRAPVVPIAAGIVLLLVALAIGFAFSGFAPDELPTLAAAPPSEPTADVGNPARNTASSREAALAARGAPPAASRPTRATPPHGAPPSAAPAASAPREAAPRARRFTPTLAAAPADPSATPPTRPPARVVGPPDRAQPVPSPRVTANRSATRAPSATPTTRAAPRPAPNQVAAAQPASPTRDAQPSTDATRPGTAAPKPQPRVSTSRSDATAPPTPAAKPSRQVAAVTAPLEPSASTPAPSSISTKSRPSAWSDRSASARTDAETEAATTPSKPAAKPAAASSAEPVRSPDMPRIAAAPVPDVKVLRTAWHPDPDRRSARIRMIESDEVVTLSEGDAVGALVVKEITPSSVLFSTGDVEVRRRVGS